MNGSLHKYNNARDKTSRGYYDFRAASAQVCDFAFCCCCPQFLLIVFQAVHLTSDKFTFVVTNGKNKRFLFAAETEQEREDWITAINGEEDYDEYEEETTKVLQMTWFS